jgi:hypothetical protein
MDPPENMIFFQAFVSLGVVNVKLGRIRHLNRIDFVPCWRPTPVLGNGSANLRFRKIVGVAIDRNALDGQSWRRQWLRLSASCEERQRQRSNGAVHKV